ncbi:hypothetical protein Q0Z83_049230 [Actinoplanes sichuanensis]|uniref:Transposase n=1 Tax=Actinoplanes sichuanensis TaxID=512349 RepID=A0ABW4ANQ0_9ACTN|nr:hypothetical protein [Actinoplanes sichuanensis]BEL06732.1 hypothetical protein Q0Z83_049230 [Actinoplanes sichuanensis]
MNLPVAVIIAVDATREQIGSARPDAPVVAHIERPRRTRTLRAFRAGLADSLIRAAHVIAPT